LPLPHTFSCLAESGYEAEDVTLLLMTEGQQGHHLHVDDVENQLAVQVFDQPINNCMFCCPFIDGCSGYVRVIGLVVILHGSYDSFLLIAQTIAIVNSKQQTVIGMMILIILIILLQNIWLLRVKV
jgi:hypothetical protein